MAGLFALLDNLTRFDTSLLGFLAKLLLFVPTLSLFIYIVLNEIVRLQGRIPNLPGPWGYPLLGSLPSLRGTATSDEYRIVRNIRVPAV